ncbi:MAG: MMPL family transporter, partial [Thaumarchaeota archaeon]|nr:MMPL family transporter [Nitrososphaerota archaeon]
MIIAVWIIALIAAIPAALNEGSVLSLQQGSSSGSNLESSQAANLIQAQFSKSVPNNTLIVVVTASNVTTPSVQDYVNGLASQIKGDKNFEGAQGVTSVFSVLYPILNGTATGAHTAMTEANSTAQLLYGVPSLYVNLWSATYDQTKDVPSANSAAYSQASNRLSAANATEYQRLTSHLLAGFNDSWSKSFSDPSTANFNALQRGSLAANDSLPAFITAYLPNSSSFGMALVRSYSLQTYQGTTAQSNHKLAAFAVNYVANSSALSPQLVNATMTLGTKPTQAQLESLTAGVVWKPSRYAAPPQLDSLIASFVSPNANTTLISVNYAQSSTANVLEARSLISKTGIDNNNSASSVSSVQVTGGDAISNDFSGSTTSDLGLILPVTIALLIVATGLFFRSLVTPFVTLGSIGVALGISQVFIVLAGTYIAKVDFTIPTILLTILIGVGTDYSVFIISRYKEERTKGLPAKQAIVTSITWAGESITTSGATVIISFLSLTFTSVTFLKTMGVVVGLGVLVALAVSLTLVPAIMASISESMFWPTSGKRFADHSRDVRSKLEKRSGYFSKSGAFAVKRAKVLIVVAMLVSVPALYVYLGTTPTYN